jgi:hypothetical protein
LGLWQASAKNCNGSARRVALAFTTYDVWAGALCFFFAFVGGLMAFPIMFAVVLLPLRAGLRRFMPHRTQRTHAIAAALVLWSLATAWVVAHVLSGIPSLPFQHGYLCHWIFWSIFSFAVAISFFWPFGASNSNSSYDHAA